MYTKQLLMHKTFKKIKNRPGKEIKIESILIDNKNIKAKVGTTNNKHNPETVYIIVSFWTKIKQSDINLDANFSQTISKKYNFELKKIKSNLLNPVLINNKLFPYYQDNVFTYDFPENINYSKKPSYTSIELNLHTSNTPGTITNNSLILKKDSILFQELLGLINIIGNSDLLQSKLEFEVMKTKNSPTLSIK